jgi:hypothetical protein
MPFQALQETALTYLTAVLTLPNRAILDNMVGRIALPASHGSSIGTIFAPMSLLIADAAGTFHDARVRALSLVVTAARC